jgi:hypothetical protein
MPRSLSRKADWRDHAVIGFRIPTDFFFSIAVKSDFVFRVSGNLSSSRSPKNTNTISTLQ